MSDPSERPWHITLTRSHAIRFLLTNRYVQPTVHTITVTLFAGALWTAFTGSRDPSTNFGSVAFFGLWWSTVMLVSLLVIVLWAVFSVDHVLGDGVAGITAVAEPWPDVLEYFVSVFAAIGIYTGVNALGAW